MFTLKVTKEDGSIEQSDFKTNDEAVAWQAHLGEIGYVDCTYEIITTQEVLANISRRQIRLALLAINIRATDVVATINSLPDNQKEQAMIAWEDSVSFERLNPVVIGLGQMMGLSSDQLDAVWKAGILL
jgi:hypothetical protein